MAAAINPARINAAEYDAIVVRLRDGASFADVAEEFKRGKSTIRRLAARIR